MKKIVILIIAVLLTLGIVGFASAQDTCWVENFLDTDYTVCEVEGGIYIQTPTPTLAVGSIFGGPDPINNFLPGWHVGSIFGGPEPINNKPDGSIFGGTEPINNFLPGW